MRQLQQTTVNQWLVVPKPNKSIPDGYRQNRLWRLSFQDFEKEMIKGCQQLKIAIRLVKKLRDSLGMKAIASYYIKTLVLWKVHHVEDKKYWQKKISVLFKDMVEDLYKAVDKKNIPYFWNENNNLIDGVKPSVLQEYAKKLKVVLNAIEVNDIEQVAFSLLNADEMKEFQNSEFYKTQEVLQSLKIYSSPGPNIKIVNPMTEVSTDKVVNKINEDVLLEYIKDLYSKIDRLTVEVSENREDIKKLRQELHDKRESDSDIVSNTV